MLQEHLMGAHLGDDETWFVRRQGTSKQGWWSSHNVWMARWHLNKDDSCLDTKQCVRLLKGLEVICMKRYIQISRRNLTIGFYKIHFNVVCAMINIANCTL
jgi:hypothetical protein